MFFKMLGCFGCLSGLLGVVVAAVCLVALMTILGAGVFILRRLGDPRLLAVTSVTDWVLLVALCRGG